MREPVDIQQLTELTDDAAQSLIVGDGLRMVSAHGLTYEGPVDEVIRTYGYLSRVEAFVVGGRTFRLRDFDFYTVDKTAVVPLNHKPHKPNTHEVLECLALLSRNSTPAPYAVTAKAIAEQIIGFDPSQGTTTPRFGGRTADAWFNEFVAIEVIRRILEDQTVKSGVLRKVMAGGDFGPRNDSPFVLFRHTNRVGYVRTKDYDASVEANAVAATGRTLDALRAQATATIALRHAAEVETEVARLIEAAGL